MIQEKIEKGCNTSRMLPKVQEHSQKSLLNVNHAHEGRKTGLTSC